WPRDWSSDVCSSDLGPPGAWPCSSANWRRSSSVMVANSRPRFFAMDVTPHGGFEQRLEPPEVFVHPGARVGAEELDHRATGPPRRRAVAEAEIDPGPGAFPAEPDDPRVVQHRARLAAPREQPVRGPLRQHGVPLDRQVAGPTYDPARAQAAEILDLAHVGHEEREVFIVLPEGVDLLGRCLDVQRLLDVHGPAPLASG